MEELAQVTNSQFWVVVAAGFVFGIIGLITLIAPARGARLFGVDNVNPEGQVYVRGLGARNVALALAAAAALIVDNKWVLAWIGLGGAFVAAVDVFAITRVLPLAKAAKHIAYFVILLALGLWLLLY